MTQSYAPCRSRRICRGSSKQSGRGYLAKIERLAELQQKGILTPEEFAAKKTELLQRL